MMNPTVDQLSMGKYNRYTLVVATAKCARLVTEEYVKQRENAEKMLANKETDRSLSSMIRREYRDEKAVRTAIHRFMDGEYQIVDSTVPKNNQIDD